MECGKLQSGCGNLESPCLDHHEVDAPRLGDTPSHLSVLSQKQISQVFGKLKTQKFFALYFLPLSSLKAFTYTSCVGLLLSFTIAMDGELCFTFSVASFIFTNSPDWDAFYNPADGSSLYSMGSVGSLSAYMSYSGQIETPKDWLAAREIIGNSS